jgi:hypothetical protein
MVGYLTQEQRVPVDHPRLAIRLRTEGILQSLDAELGKPYKATGRRSVDGRI